MPSTPDATAALGAIGPEAGVAVPGLIERLNDKTDPIRWMAADALGHIGQQAEVAVPALLVALGDTVHAQPDGYRTTSYDDRQMPRQARVRTLTQFERGWRTDADFSGPAVGSAAATALVRFGTEAVPGLMGALEDDDANVRRMAVKILGRIGPAARSAEPSLRPLLRDVDKRVRQAAAESLKQIDPTKPAKPDTEPGVGGVGPEGYGYGVNPLPAPTPISGR